MCMPLLLKSFLIQGPARQGGYCPCHYRSVQHIHARSTVYWLKEQNDIVARGARVELLTEAVK